jgi:ribosome-associated protein
MSETLSTSRFLPPEEELDERFILTGGPGGQHVNRTETGVQLRFDAAHTEFIDDAVRARLLKLAGRRVNKDGVITIEARRFRSQHRNRVDARERLARLIEQAHQAPKKRKKTVPSRAAKARTRKKQQHRKEIKRARRKPRLDD